MFTNGRSFLAGLLEIITLLIHFKIIRYELTKIVYRHAFRHRYRYFNCSAKGTDTRKKLSDSVDNIKDKIRRIRGTTNDELEELHEVFEHEISGLRDDMREKVLRLIEVSKKSYNHVKSEALS